jgi:hypothetical protein
MAPIFRPWYAVSMAWAASSISSSPCRRTRALLPVHYAG